MIKTISKMGCCLVLLMLVHVQAMSQIEGPRAYAIVGAKIVTGPGTIIEKGNIILRDGLIQAVGADAVVPADAFLIEAEEGWTVYPAFIDAATGTGLKAEKQDGAPDMGAMFARLMAGNNKERKGAPHELEGIHPEHAVVDELVIDESAISKHRKMGFATAQVLPRKGLFRGNTAVINLRKGEHSELILSAHHAQTLAFETGMFFGGSYPSSRMGAVAAVRQAFLDASRLGVWQKRHSENPGIQRPHYQSSTQNLLDVIEGRRPLLFVADFHLGYERMAKIGAEFSVKPAMVLATGAERFVMDVVKELNAPILLPLEFPKKPDWKDNEGLEDITLQDMQAYLNAPLLPQMLDEAGIPYAFVTEGMESLSGFTKNLAKVVDQGLSPDKALAALTTTPAKLLGMQDVLGTLEPGKIANLFVVNGDLFVDKPKFHYLFVDGIHEKFEVKGGKGDPNATGDPVGTWEVATEVMGRSSESIWSISKEGDSFKGYSESDSRGRVDFEAIDLSGNELTITMPSPMGSSIELTAIIDGDKMEGETDIEVPQMGSSITIKIKGKRVDKNPKGGMQ